MDLGLKGKGFLVTGARASGTAVDVGDRQWLGIRVDRWRGGERQRPRDSGLSTKLAHELRPASFQTALGLNPTGRLATPREVANAVVFLSSSAANFSSGTNLVVDGALTRGVQL